jgi:hypothetical protein
MVDFVAVVVVVVVGVGVVVVVVVVVVGGVDAVVICFVGDDIGILQSSYSSGVQMTAEGIKMACEVVKAEFASSPDVQANIDEFSDWLVQTLRTRS